MPLNDAPGHVYRPSRLMHDGSSDAVAAVCTNGKNRRKTHSVPELLDCPASSTASVRWYCGGEMVKSGVARGDAQAFDLEGAKHMTRHLPRPEGIQAQA